MHGFAHNPTLQGPATLLGTLFSAYEEYADHGFGLYRQVSDQF